jgi:hypothetical protein
MPSLHLLLYRIAFTLARFVAIEGRRRDPLHSLGHPPGADDRPSVPLPPAAPPPDDLDVRIADLGLKIERLSCYIDARFDDLEPDQLRRLLALYGQLNNCLGRLKRDRAQVKGDDADDRTRALDQALDRLSKEWGIDL